MQNVEPRDGDHIASLERVAKSFGTFRALNDITFNIREGEVFGYIGPNGAGKTTTIKILVGLIKDYEGVARVGSGGSGANMDRALGYLPQHAAFQEWRTVDQALTTFGRLSGMSIQDVEKRIPEVLELLGILDTRNRRIVNLSGGTIQKVGMAQAILHDPDFLVLDEPMAGLDPASRYQFKNVFRQLSKEGTTVLFSSHILSDVQDIANRIGIISHGTLIHEGTLEGLRQRLKVPKDIDIMLSKDSRRWKELESIQGVTSIDRTEDGRMIVHLAAEADIDASVDRLIRKIIEGGSRIRFIYPINPNLEQLYIRFVSGGAST
ncbi:MAG: ABC transporter ATP-binding protein [Candidatus Thermoplasmatota archaeon]|nr:ABC transporter ATP-binding protein [Candidatus Thermoplasmatota archaeon]